MGEYKWYAMYTRSRAEKKAYRDLVDLNVEVYLPLITKFRKWSDRVKPVEMPLLSSYIFVKVSEKEYYDVLNLNNVVCYICFEGKAAPIPENQINSLKVLCEASAKGKVEVQALDFAAGEQVVINQGDFEGFSGEIVHQKGSSRLIVRLQHLNCSISLEINASMVDKLIKKEA